MQALASMAARVIAGLCQYGTAERSESAPLQKFNQPSMVVYIHLVPFGNLPPP